MSSDDTALAALVAALVDRRPAPRAPIADVRRHRLAPLAFRAGLAELRHDYIVASLRAEQQRAIAAEAVVVLGRAGIPAALLKGASYAAWLYDDPGERPMTDIDVLVPLQAVDPAMTALAALGYVHTGGAHQLTRRHHGITLKRAQGGSIDLHRSPIQLGRTAIDLDAVWRRATPAPWIPGALRLESIDETLFHVANLVRHEMIVPLLSYVDAGRLLRRLDAPAWAILLARAEQWRCRRVVTAALEVIEHVVGWRASPPRWWLPSRREIVSLAHRSRAAQVARKLLLVDGPREFAGFAVSLVADARARR